jgi:hypothetical protein
LLHDVAQLDINPELIKTAHWVRKNAFVMNRIEKLTNAVNVFDLAVITASIDEIRNLNIEVDPDLVGKGEEIIEEAKKNPNFIAEKQKEVQKAMKGKKK